MVEDCLHRPKNGVDARAKHRPFDFCQGSASKVGDGPHLVVFGKQADLAVPELPGLQDPKGVSKLDFLKHRGLECGHCWLRHVPPDIVPEVK
jgi:hypothetical protein